jgi:uncharacterized protein
VSGVYEKQVDRESAYEKLTGKATAAPAGGAVASPAPAKAGGGMMDSLKDVLFGTTGPCGAHHAGLAETAAKSTVRSIGSAVGREIIRGVLGSILCGSGSGSRRR